MTVNPSLDFQPHGVTAGNVLGRWLGMRRKGGTREVGGYTRRMKTAQLCPEKPSDCRVGHFLCFKGKLMGQERPPIPVFKVNFPATEGLHCLGNFI